MKSAVAGCVLRRTGGSGQAGIRCCSYRPPRRKCDLDNCPKTTFPQTDQSIERMKRRDSTHNTTSRLTCGFVLAALLSVAARGQPGDEYRAKAVALFTLSKFVEWPPEAFRDSTDPISICVLGTNPFGDLLYHAVSGRVVQGRSFSILQVADIPQARLCHILFITGSERSRLRTIFNGLSATGTLTVGDTEGFTRQGGVVNMRMSGGDVRFHVNLSAAAQQRLQISARLLNLAELVRK